MAAALRERGVEEPDASLLADAGIAVLRIAFGQWIAETERRGYPEIVRDALARLQAITAG